MKDYQAKAELCARRVYMDTHLQSLNARSMGLTAPLSYAQAANELLETWGRGIKASVVLTDYGCRPFTSACSIDEVNVQVMMG